MAQYDIYNIEQRLREWDENILRIEFDHKRQLHQIVCRDKLGDEYIAMTAPLGKLDARVVYRMMEINPKRGYNPFDEIDTSEAIRQRDMERRVEDMSYNIGDMLHKPLVQHALY